MRHKIPNTYESTLYAQNGSESLCEFETQDLTTGQSSSALPFSLSLDLGEREYSSKNLGVIDGKTFVGKIYGTNTADRFTLTLEIQMPDGLFLPRAASSFYVDGRDHMLAVVEGKILLKFWCRARL